MSGRMWAVLTGMLVIACVMLFIVYSAANRGYKLPPAASHPLTNDPAPNSIHPSTYTSPPMAFSGDSSAAKQTVVVPTLDTPMPKGKNVIWCGTVQLCWDGLRSLPGMQLPNDTDTLRRINAAKMNQADLSPNEYYTAAGWMKDGIVQKIQADMAAKFSKVKPDVGLSEGDTVALAYAYLAAQVKFTTPYFNRDNGDEFTDSAGNKTLVSTFGMFHDRGADINHKLAKQIQIFCSRFDENEEFALDLDKNSTPNQMLLAVTPRGADLAATWNHLKKHLEQLKSDGEQNEFTQFDTLIVPNILFHIQHQFQELEEGPVSRFTQSLDFRLDKSGAVMASEAVGEAFGDGLNCEFTRPFLIVMRKRGATEPYFVMWVDNAELLCKQGK